MKPIAIFRHARTEGPGYLATFLDAHNVPWQLICVDENDALPNSIESFSGLIFMGGAMSVNDDLPWIPPVLAMIRNAVKADIPVLGHCLGGQLMSKALGGAITKNPIKEIGWGQLTVADNPEAQHWFGDTRQFTGFHWHGETFSIPTGAIAILSSTYCANQAFTMGKHLGFQCHIEMTESMIREWCENGADEIAAACSPAVQPPAVMFDSMAEKVASLNMVAGQVYSQWIKGLK